VCRHSPTACHPLTPKLQRNLTWEIIIVDDASPDGTQEVAEQLITVYGPDRIVRICLYSCFECWSHVFPSVPEAKSWETRSRVRSMCCIRRSGFEHSCRTAYIYGLKFCTGDFVIIMDADFSHHVRRLPFPPNIVFLNAHTRSRNSFHSSSSAFLLKFATPLFLKKDFYWVKIAKSPQS
jgi:hypothetical protein